MWSIALKTLLADRGKLLTALIGVIFSVVLVNIQGGLFLGLLQKASLLVDYGQADIWVGHKKMHNVDFPRDIPRRWIYRIRTLPGVKRAEPYIIGFSEMTLPSGGFEAVVVVGVERKSLLGNAWCMAEGQSHDVTYSNGIIVDACDNKKLEQPQIGDVREIAGLRARIVAKSDGIAGFLVAPYVFTTFERGVAFLRKRRNACSYFLIQVEEGADVEEVCSAIRQRLPDADALTRDQYSRTSVNFWMTRTGLGLSFGAATALGLFVGLVIVAQTLYAMVLDRLSEFGTLKAIGANELQIYQVLFLQAMVMAGFGSVLGLATVATVQHFFNSPRVPILIPLWLSLGSCILVAVICFLSSLLPYLRIRKVDPQVVLQS